MKPRDYDLNALWIPFTANRQFKSAPRILVAAKDMHYVAEDGRRILDGTAGLWCVNAGHCRTPIVEAIQRQAESLDYSPLFQMGHPGEFRAAGLVAALAPEGLDHVFFVNSGSEAVDTALKIALAYQRAIGEGTRTRLIGRERGYHGVNFGGMSVGGIGGSSAKGGQAKTQTGMRRKDIEAKLKAASPQAKTLRRPRRSASDPKMRRVAARVSA